MRSSRTVLSTPVARIAAILSILAALAGSVSASAERRPTRALEWELVEAETAVGQGELRVAESRYRAALREARHLLGLLAVLDGDLGRAEALLDASRGSAAEGVDGVRRALAEVRLHRGKTVEGLKDLRLLAHGSEDVELAEGFLRALLAVGQEEEAAVELRKLRQTSPDRADAVEALPEQDLLPPVDTAGLDALDDAERRALEKRLEATEVRLLRYVGRLQAETDFADAAVRAAIPPNGGAAFGRPVLDSPEPLRRIRPLTDAAVRRPDAFPAALRDVVELVEKGDLASAATKLEERLAAGDDPDARTLLGMVELLRGDEETGEALLLEAVEHHPSPLAARQALARHYAVAGRAAEAKQQLLQAAELGPLDRDLALALADLELLDGRIPAANRQLRSLDRRFGSVEALLRLADVFERLGNPKASMDYLEKALGEAPNSEEVLLVHARRALAGDLVPVAVRSVEPLARLRPEKAEYQYLLGRAWIGLGKMGEASEALLRAVELDPGFVPAFLPLGLALNHESRFEEARGYLNRYLEERPEDLEAAAGLAESEERLGEAEAAEKRAAAVLEKDPDVARAHLVLGMVRSGRGDFGAARESLERAIAVDPGLGKAHYQLSFACARLGDRACAREHLERYRRAQEGPDAEAVVLQAAPETQVLEKANGGGR